MSEDSDSSSTDSSQITIAITLQAPVWRDSLPDVEELARRAARAALARSANRSPELGEAEVSLALADDATLRRLNRDYRRQDEPTNVLSFAAAESAAPEPVGPVLLGDVVIAYETVRREAEEQDKRLADHFCHLVVHGVLHLLGYDHETAAEAEEMARLEIAVLADLGVADPYAQAARGEAAAGRL